MNLILDTHIFLWAIASPEKLTGRQREEIEQPTNRLFLSAISVAELMIKASLGKLTFPFDPREAALASGIETLPFTAEDAIRLGALPFHHRDPFDRMLIAQAQARGFIVMTADRQFASYDVRLSAS